MKKKYLYPLIIILTIFLSFFDINIINHNQNIINVGINNQGLTPMAPTIISETTMNNILLFTTNDHAVLNNYTLITKKEKHYLKKYSILENQNIYLLKDINKESIKELEKNIKDPLIFVYKLETMSNKELNSLLGDNMDRSKIDIYTFFKYINEGQRYEIYNKYIENINNKQKLIQDAIFNEYKLFDKNKSQIKNEYIIKEIIKIILCLFLIISTFYIQKKFIKKITIPNIFQYSNILLGYSIIKIMNKITSLFLTIVILLLEILFIALLSKYKNVKLNHKIEIIIPFASSIMQIIIMGVILITKSNTAIMYYFEIILSIFMVSCGIITISTSIKEGSLINGQKNNTNIKIRSKKTKK